MNQQQPHRNQEQAHHQDAFVVQGDLSGKAVAHKDATAVMQMSENSVAAAKNERSGLVGHDETGVESGVGGIKLAPFPGKSVNEYIGDEVATGQCGHGDLCSSDHDSASEHGGGITIGEALEATALTAGKKPVEWSDAAAIQAAEVRATGRTSIMPGGIAAAAQSAATLNARATRDEDKTKLGTILANATARLPSDKPATRKDAEGVMGAEMRNDPNLTIHPAGVAASIAAAARLNQSHK
ncbi:late embryoproteinsis abundant protein D-34-like isoform X2 [Hibiscus syriacus]|uniref:Late embryoproteinsis abundant protein D-34-like isoform X2 n=1 Tax=Hibiscus syriacus TaxID=106335 RepID=A0A6A2WSI4_HIBSY|nr:late embryogenesis abundant protein 47-like [Hibiscus syriacus]KAE8664133.1 late embryoproteinsis abundant protein D-34-like isoform X2 [Hibiscus syriacus]